MQDLLAAAIEMHHAGRLDQAARLYEQLLNQEPHNADALHLLGVLSHQLGENTRAVDLMGRAVTLRPDDPAFHANLAEAYRALGQQDRAADCCRAALRLRPDFPEALCNLGLALHGLDRHAEAIEQFRHALRLRPELASAHNGLGICLRALKRYEEAIAHFRQAVELAPNGAPAQSNLGQCLVDLGQAVEALPHCLEAVRLQPDQAALHFNLGNAFRALSRWAEAQDAYREALRLDGNLAPAHAHLGLALRQEGRLADALPPLERAVELEPSNAAFWELLAELRGEREEQAEAIACWERVLALAPDSAPARLSLGWALQEAGRLTEAGEQYRGAAKMQPGNAMAPLNLGRLHEEQGELKEAEECYREALRLQPDFALPHGQLATLLRGKFSDADRAALEQRLADPHLDAMPRARLLFGLAHVLDAQADYARAADCLRQANALTLEMQRGARRYVPAEHERFVVNLQREFSAAFFARTVGMGLDTRRPVFVFGLPRSGTTLIEQVLASHPQVYGAGELGLARRTFEAIPSALGCSDPPLACLSRLDAVTLRGLAQRHDDQLAALADGCAARVVDKMPDNYLYLGLLAALFPRGVFIHCRRDLRDVAVSCWMTDFRSLRWANDPGHIAGRFRQYVRLMEHWRKVLPVAIHEVDYEEAVADLEPVARGMVTACGLSWDPVCLEFHRTQRPVRTASVVQVRQPVYTRSAGRWKYYETALADLFAALPATELDV
jgi:tetratricopeptide (TPR) repeat protein